MIRDRSASAASGVFAHVLANDVAPLPPPPKNAARRALGEFSLRLFIETYFAESAPLAWSPSHLKIIEAIEDRVEYGGLKAIAMPRGSGKTTILLIASLWAILYGNRKFVSIIAANETIAVSNLNTIKTYINHNQLLAEDFALELHCLQKLGGEPRRVTSQHYQGEHTGVEYSTRRIDFGTIPGSACSGSLISAVGITGAVRGQHKATISGEVVRPDFVLVDDPQTKSSAASRSQCVKRHEIMMGDVLGMAGPGVNISGFCTCTVIYKGDLADKLLDIKASPDWDGSRVSMIEKWPTWLEGWDQYNSIRVEELAEGKQPLDSTTFVIANFDRLHEGSQTYWEARKREDDVSSLQHSMDLFFRDQGVFYAEYQNLPQSVAETPPFEINPDLLCRRISGFDRAVVPPDTKLLTAFIDVQKDLLYYVIVAWGNNGSGFVIDYGACPDQGRHYWSKGTTSKSLQDLFGDEMEEYLRAALQWLTKAILETDYRMEDGGVIQVEKLAIDARWGEATHIIRKFARESTYRARIHPSMGMYIGANSQPWQKIKADKKDKTGVHAKLQTPKVSGQRELLYDTNYWKSFTADRLVCSQSAAKAILLFKANPHEHRMFAEHCAFEECKRKPAKNGGEVTEWTQDRTGGTVENDYWDGLVGNCALASTIGVATHHGTRQGNANIAAAVAAVKAKGKFFKSRN